MFPSCFVTLYSAVLCCEPVSLSTVLFWEACVCLIAALCFVARLCYVSSVVLCCGPASPVLLATALYSFTPPCCVLRLTENSAAFDCEMLEVVGILLVVVVVPRGGGGSDKCGGGGCYTLLRWCFCETEAISLVLLTVRSLR